MPTTHLCLCRLCLFPSRLSLPSLAELLGFPCLSLLTFPCDKVLRLCLLSSSLLSLLNSASGERERTSLRRRL